MTVRMYSDQGAPRRGWLAHQCYPILVSRAINHQVISYRELGDLIGHPPHYLGPNVLEPIAAWCRQGGLLPLTVVVVSENLGAPGDGFEGDRTKLFEVFAFKDGWTQIVPPSPEELDEAARQG